MAIGLVTRAIAELLDKKLNPPGATTTLRVTTLPPDDDRVDIDNGVNLFLYRVTDSPFAKNNDWVGDRPNLRTIKRSPLSLVLQYMLTAYVQKISNSVRDDVSAQQILGRAMAILHEFPVLNDIHDSDFDSDLDTQFAPELRQAFDKIKVTFSPTTTDEFSKIWTGFSKAYRLSAAYEVSLLQIVPTLPPPSIAPPVQQTVLLIDTISSPVISSIEPATGPAGAQVTIRGNGFKSPGRSTLITVGDVLADEIEIISLTENVAVLTIPTLLGRGPDVGIVVTTGGLSSLPAIYRVEPWIRTIQPLRGITGVPITIPMEVPSGATVSALVDGNAAAATVDSVNKSVRVMVPTGIPTNGFKSVAVIVDDGTPSSSNVRTYELLPRIQSVTREVNAGPPLTTAITVIGERLSGAKVQIRYGKWRLDGVVTSNGASVRGVANGVLPAGQPASVIVDGRESSVLPPRLDSLDPPQAARGEAVTLTGNGLSGQSVVVRFGSVDLPAIAQPFASRFSVAVPAGLAAGGIKVKVIVQGNETNEMDFTVLT